MVDPRKSGTKTSAFPIRYAREHSGVLWCWFAHFVLIVAHYVLLVLGSKPPLQVPVAGLSESDFETIFTFAISAFGMLYLSLLLMLTQRLALRRNLFQSQDLTTLHDRTASWLGLWTAIKALAKARPLSGYIALITLYLGLLFGLHNTIPALVTVSPVHGSRNTSVPIMQMTPPMNASLDVATILPLQYLPATLGLPAPGLHGSTIQDTMQPLSDPGILTVTLLEDDVLYDPEATLCATTFQPACEVMASSNFITSLDAAGARTLDVTFDDGWTARVYPSAVAWNSSNNGAAPTIRIVPAPAASESSQPQVPYVTLLAPWNVTSNGSGIAYNTIHVQNVSESLDLDLTFLKCTLDWNVCSVLNQQFGTPQNECSVNKRVCNRTDIMPIEQRADPVNYNWTSIWTQAVSWNDGNSQPGLGVVNGTPRVVDDYLMNALGWKLANADWGARNPSGFPPKLPTLDQMTQGLGDTTAALFWLASWASDQARPTPYFVAAQTPFESPQYAGIGISGLAAIGGLFFSILAFLNVIVLFWGRQPFVPDISDAGILETAWLFLREPEDLQPLLAVETPTPSELRKVGQRIRWKGVVEKNESETKSGKSYV